MSWFPNVCRCRRRRADSSMDVVTVATKLPCCRVVVPSILCCRRLRRKEKGADDEDTEELELGLRNRATATSPECLANGQDGDEAHQGAGLRPTQGIEVPAWQVPKLVIENLQRPSVRANRSFSLILPEAGGDLLNGIVANLPVVLQIRPTWHLGYSMSVDGVSLRSMYRQTAEAGPCILIVEDSNSCIFGAFLSEGLRPSNQCYGTHECFVFRYARDAGSWHVEVFGQAPPCPEDPPSVALEALALAAAELDEVAVPLPGNSDHSSEGHEDESTGTSGEERSDSDASAQFGTLRKCKEDPLIQISPGAVFCDHTGIVVGIDGPGLFINQDLLRGVSWPSKAFGSPCLATTGNDFVLRNLEVWHWAS